MHWRRHWKRPMVMIETQGADGRAMKRNKQEGTPFTVFPLARRVRWGGGGWGGGELTHAWRETHDKKEPNRMALGGRGEEV